MHLLVKKPFINTFWKSAVFEVTFPYFFCQDLTLFPFLNVHISEVVEIRPITYLIIAWSTFLTPNNYVLPRLINALFSSECFMNFLRRFISFSLHLNCSLTLVRYELSDWTVWPFKCLLMLFCWDRLLAWCQTFCLIWTFCLVWLSVLVWLFVLVFLTFFSTLNLLSDTSFCLYLKLLSASLSWMFSHLSFLSVSLFAWIRTFHLLDLSVGFYCTLSFLIDYLFFIISLCNHIRQDIIYFLISFCYHQNS